MSTTTTTRRRRGFAALAATLLGLTAALVGASPAWAAGYIYHAPGGSYGFYDFSVSADWLHLTDYPQDMTANWCYDTILDWYRGPGHFDSRLARSCKDWTTRTTGQNYESSAVDLVNVQKLGVCYGPNQHTNQSPGGCTNQIGSVTSVNTFVGASNYCVRAWSMTTSGTNQYFSGGVTTSCTS